MPAVIGVSNAAAWTVSLAVLLAVSRLHSMVPGLTTIRFPFLVSIVGLVLLLSQTARWRPSDLRRHFIPRTIGLILLLAVGSVPFGIYPGAAFGFLQGAYIRTLLIAALVWGVARTPGGAVRLSRSLALGGIVACALALRAGRTDITGRLSGAYTYDSNDLALITVVAIPLTIAWITDTTSRLRYVMITGLPVLMLTLVKTGSRGGFLGLATVILGFGFLATFRTKERVGRLARTMVIASMFALPFLPSSVWERLGTLVQSEDDYNVTASSGRLAIWKRGMSYALRYPVFGVGINNFPTAEGRISDLAKNRDPDKGLKWSAAHNSYVQVSAELGLIAGVAFVLLTLRPILPLLLYDRRRPAGPAADPRLSHLAPFLGITMAAFSTSAFFLSFAYSDVLYYLLALAAAVLASGPAVASALPPPREGVGRPAGTPHYPIGTPVTRYQPPKAAD